VNQTHRPPRERVAFAIGSEIVLCDSTLRAASDTDVKRSIGAEQHVDEIALHVDNLRRVS
jgi:hypothetical protein